MFRKLFHQEFKSVSSAAFVLAIASIASRILGVVRDRVIAYRFGASNVTDIYYASFRLPDLVYNMIVLGAISSAFIPVLTGYFAKKQSQDAWRLANGVLTMLLLVLGVFSVLLYFTVPWILPWLIGIFDRGQAAEYALSAEHLAMTIQMTRIMLISPIILGMSSVVGGILNVKKRFVSYSLAPVMYNIGIIIGALVFVQYWGIYGLAYGVVLGTVFHLLIQIPSVMKVGYRIRFVVDFADKGLRRMLRLMVPRTLTLAVTQINLLVISFIAFVLAEGELAVFNFSMNLQSFPLGVFALSFAIAALPSLSFHAGEGKMNKFIKTFSKTFRSILFYIVPSSILFLVLRAQIVRVVLGTGQFDWSDTYLTAQALGIFAVSLFAQGLVPLITRGFYALHNTVVPFVIASITVIVNVALSLLFTGVWSFFGMFEFQMGVLGLVLAYAIANLIHLGILLVMFHIRVGHLDDARIMRSAMKIGISAFIAGLCAYGMLYLLAPVLDTRTGIGILLQGLLAGTVGVGVYFGMTLALRTTEAWSVLHRIRLRLQGVEAWLNRKS